METPVIVRESFTLFFSGSQIFSMELDGLRDNVDLVMEKFERDAQFLRRPSSPSLTGVHLRDTMVSHQMAQAILDGLNAPKMHVKKAAVVGLKASNRRMFARILKAMTPSVSFSYAFFDDYEKAKEWLVK